MCYQLFAEFKINRVKQCSLFCPPCCINIYRGFRPNFPWFVFHAEQAAPVSIKKSIFCFPSSVVTRASAGISTPGPLPSRLSLLPLHFPFLFFFLLLLYFLPDLIFFLFFILLKIIQATLRVSLGHESLLPPASFQNPALSSL